MKKKRLLSLRILAWAALALVAALDVMLIFSPKRAFSPTENRNLQQFPAISLRAISSGRFEAQFDTYVADQFPLRDLWVSLEATVSRLMGRTESGGVYLGKDGYLIQRFEAPRPEQFERTTAALRAFSATHEDVNITMMAVPTAASVLREKLPAFADGGAEDAFIDDLQALLTGTNIAFVDVRETLRALAQSQQVYYRTDHHWTTDAAYQAYLSLAAAMGVPSSARYDRRLVSDSFAGTLSATSGFRRSETDEIYVYTPVEEVSCVVFNPEEGRSSASVYRTEKLSTRDQYALYFGGNYPMIRIETAAESGRVLLLLKDSYANCLTPFLIPDFSKIVMVDPRYFTDDLAALMEAEGVTDALILYNANTLASDTALARDLVRE